MPIDHPTTPGFRSIEWNTQVAVGVSESPFTLQQQVYAWPGQRRVATISLPVMAPSTAKQWLAFFLKLNGPEGTFYLSDTSVSASGASGFGTPRINGVDQVGNSIDTDGWTISTNGLLVAGDWISIEDRLYNVTDDVDSDGSGEATIEVWPKVRPAYVDDREIEVASPRGIFRLAEAVGWKWTVDRLCDGIIFNAVEVIPAS